MLGECLEGALVTLKRVGANRAAEVFPRFQDPQLIEEIGLLGPHTPETLKIDLAEEDLWLWEFTPENSSEPLGFVGIVTYSGPIYLFIHFFDPLGLDLDLAQDAILPIVHGYFQNTDESQLWFYQATPPDPDIHDRLVEAGFDLWEDEMPGVDQTKTACYVMERHTYEAYYGEGAETYEAF